MARRSGSSHDAVLVGHLVICLLGFCLSQSMLIPAVSRMRADYDASTAAVGWTMSANLVVTAVATLLIGRLGDSMSRTRLLTFCMMAFTVGGLIAATGTQIEWVIAGRAIQGLGGGVYPLVFGLVADQIHPTRRSTATSILAATIAVGGGLGLPLGGLVVDAGGTRAVIGATVLMGVLGIIASRFLIRSSATGRVRLDPASVLSLVVGLFLLLGSAGEATAHGWASTSAVGFGLSGVVILCLFGARQNAARTPVVDLATLRIPTNASVNVATVLLGATMFGSMIAVTGAAQIRRSDGGLAMTAAAAGLILVPASLALFVAGVSAPVICRRVGLRRAMVGGAFVSAAAILAMVWAHTLVPLTVLLAAAYFGIGVVYTTVPNLIAGAVHVSRIGEANGVNTLARLLGSAVGAQIVTATLAAGADGAGSPTRGFGVLAVLALATLVVAITVPRAQKNTA